MTFPRCVAILVAVGWVVLVSARPVPPPLDEGDPLNGWEIEIVVQTMNSTTRPFAEDCQEFCSYTYPQHTYPEPANFKACAAGCRSAQVDAFTAWPIGVDPLKCQQGCLEMYSQEQQQYACNTGCKTPTIDTTFPNRTHLYGEGNLTAKIDLLLPPVEDTVSFFLNSFFLPQQSTHFDNLTMHAESMEMLVMPYLRSDVTVLTDDGVYRYREYSFDSGEGMGAGGDKSFPGAAPEDDSWMSQYLVQQRTPSSCAWLLHRSVFNRILMVLSVGLVIAAMATCFLSTCAEGKRSRPKISSKTSAPPLAIKKAPYDLGAQFILPGKIDLGSYGQATHKITML